MLVFNASDPSGAGSLAGDGLAMGSVGAHMLPVVTGAYARDTAEIFDHFAFDEEAIAEQTRAILEDVEVQLIKVGFAGTPEALSTIAETAADYPEVPVVAYMPNLSWWDENEIDAYLDAFPRSRCCPRLRCWSATTARCGAGCCPTGAASARRRARHRDGGRRVRRALHLVTGTGTARPVHRQRAGLAAVGADQREATSASRPCSRVPATRCRPRWPRLLASGTDLVAATTEALAYMDRCLDAGFRPGMGHVLPDRLFWAEPEPEEDDGEPGDDPARLRPAAPRHPPLIPLPPVPDAQFRSQRHPLRARPRRDSRRRELARARLQGRRRHARFIQRAQGAYFWDANDKRYIDYIGSWGPMILGHGHPAVVEAVQKAVLEGFSYGAPTEREIELAEAILALVPSMEMVRLVSSGTEAAMSALRLARGATGCKTIVIKFEELLPRPCRRAAGQGRLGPRHLRQPDLGRRAARGGAAHAGARVQQPAAARGGLRAARQRHRLPDDRGHRRQHELRARYARVRRSAAARCARSTARLLIFDEVMTGFRVGLHGAQGVLGIEPDLTVLGKVIGGGMPLAAFGGPRAIMEQLAPLGPVYQAGTLSGNPVATACGLATLKEIAKPGFYEALGRKTRALVDGLKAAAAAEGQPFSADSEGGMFGFFLMNELPQNYAR